MNKQPNLEAIRRNDNDLRALERLDALREELEADFPEGLASVMYEVQAVIKSDRENLIASSQAALIGEPEDTQAKLRRTVKALEKIREELLDEIQNLNGQIKAGRERIKREKQWAARQAREDEARKHIAALGERLGATIDSNTRLKIGKNVGTLMGGSDGEIILYTRSTRARTVITLEELATAKLAPLPQRKAA